MLRRFKFSLTALLACGMIVSTPALADEEDDHDHEHSDIELGHIANKLSLIALPDEPIELEPFDLFGQTGWAGDEPGFFEVEAVEDGVSPLTPFSNADIRLTLVSLDNGFVLVEAGFGKTADAANEFVNLGLEGGAVHSHPTFLIDDTVVGTGFEGTGDDLARLIDNGDALTRSAIAALPDTVALLESGKVVLDTQRETASQITDFSGDLARIS